MNPELNILIGKGIKESDKALFFCEGDEFITLPDNATWIDIVVLAEIMPSKTQAKRNNWDKPIENGFTSELKGKKAKKKLITILKILE